MLRSVVDGTPELSIQRQSEDAVLTKSSAVYCTPTVAAVEVEEVMVSAQTKAEMDLGRHMVTRRNATLVSSKS